MIARLSSPLGISVLPAFSQDDTLRLELPHDMEAIRLIATFGIIKLRLTQQVPLRPNPRVTAHQIGCGACFVTIQTAPRSVAHAGIITVHLIDPVEGEASPSRSAAGRFTCIVRYGDPYARIWVAQDGTRLLGCAVTGEL